MTFFSLPAGTQRRSTPRRSSTARSSATTRAAPGPTPPQVPTHSLFSCHSFSNNTFPALLKTSQTRTYLNPRTCRNSRTSLIVGPTDWLPLPVCGVLRPAAGRRGPPVLHPQEVRAQVHGPHQGRAGHRVLPRVRPPAAQVRDAERHKAHIQETHRHKARTHTRRTHAQTGSSQRMGYEISLDRTPLPEALHVATLEASVCHATSSPFSDQ